MLAQDLVDELHLMIGPVVLGAGTPAAPADEVRSSRSAKVRRRLVSGVSWPLWFLSPNNIGAGCPFPFAQLVKTG
ncbi:MAG: hypothetical protein AB1566_10255 [Chloroflexota bacterium]